MKWRKIDPAKLPKGKVLARKDKEYAYGKITKVLAIGFTAVPDYECSALRGVTHYIKPSKICKTK